MKRINLLDENTANKIAAGEVVERPSSVVKELIENSIDANATNITIEIEEGGVSLIRIIDDGDGIHPDDMKKAFLPHATSKIKDSNDIHSITTLGFRGEALPSIAAVSKVNVKSKIVDCEFGYEIQLDGGQITDYKECGCNKGTTIEVRDLFYNVPARKKFLKSISRETSIITDIINRIAIANPKISFKLYNSGKKVIHTYGNGNLKDVLRTIYGKNISESLIEFEKAGDTLTIYGFIGKEDVARGSRNNQSIFVNGRYIKHKTIVAAVENAFKSFSTVNKFPFFVLFIDIYPELVDVNIHPTKAEIKFTDDRMIFKSVFDTVHNALKKDVFDDFSIPEENESIKYDYEEMKLDVGTNNKESVTFQSFENREKYNLEIDSPKEELKIPIDFNERITDEPIQSISYNKEEKSLPPINKETPVEEEKSAKFPPLKIIGQFNKTYILGEYDETLYIIDQHAAHEKILFEKYMKNIEEGSLVVQPLLVPVLIELTADDYIYYEENKQIFVNAGFVLEDFGGNTLSLKEVPYFLGKLEPKNLILSIIDNLKELGSGKTTEIKYNKIATMACKAAVKGNDSLNEIEMVKLIEELRYIEDPFHCPHGRPTIVKISNYELEKKFRRIV